MKTLTIRFILVLALLAGFTACSSSSDDSGSSTNDTPSDTIADVVLTHGQSVSCSDTNTFSIEPSAGNEPDVTFSTNTATGVTTITYESSDGSATVVGCLQP